MNDDDDSRRVVAEVSTKASLFAEQRVAVLLALAPGELTRERLALELTRAYVVGHLDGVQHAWAKFQKHVLDLWSKPP